MIAAGGTVDLRYSVRICWGIAAYLEAEARTHCNENGPPGLPRDGAASHYHQGVMSISSNRSQGP